MTARVVGVIPARWGSTRFPGKSLAPIGGRPLLAWVTERARQARRLEDLFVATDDERIAAAARSWGVPAVMTRSDHPSGTDRIAEAIRQIRADVILNIQGDEPLIDPALIDRVAAALVGTADTWDMATAATPIRSPEELANPDVVKVVRADDGRALYFSRAVIPHIRGAAPGELAPGIHLRHVGLYGYQRAFLEGLVAVASRPLENLEKLEQLRALAIGGRILVLDADSPGIGVDSPADVPRAEALLRQAGLLG